MYHNSKFSNPLAELAKGALFAPGVVPPVPPDTQRHEFA